MDLARKTNGVIINADSMQLYRDLPLLTAQPSAEDRRAVPHKLYGFLDPGILFSAAAWKEKAEKTIREVLDEKLHPVIVGGTGLYLKALTEGLSAMPEIPPEIRAAAMARQKEIGNPGFHAELASRDPVMGARLNPNDTQRLIRAWEVLDATGESLSVWQSLPPAGAPENWHFKILIATPYRAVLHARCDSRFDQMMETGVIEEAEAFERRIAAGECAADAPATRALGFMPLRDWLQGRISREEAVFRAKADTRQYAKRQDTWFRHQIRPLPCIEEITRLP